ncbi:Hypothetical protein R9X50_00427500 [Acrodontium crateriforme]|uniref:Uncharacterized protein n=1 Tax=Acrodontium crateriforme TaxID=150365 RepID=A0AAQ3M4F0_9PEZI|nr:Hypothetical protein R9X50_00427500 [Acrodontium crateriforme]
MAAARKDMRRNDLIVPYMAPKEDKDSSDIQSTMASTLPMAAIFTRNKMIGWTSVIVALQQWLSETSTQKANASSPAYLSVGMALLSVAVSYLPLFMPPQANVNAVGTGTGAPAAVPA